MDQDNAVDNEVSPAVKTAKNSRERDVEYVVTLPQGVRVKIIPVSATLIDEVVSYIEDPPIPIWHNPDKDRDEPNVNDPEYARAVEDAEHKRGIAAMDAMVLFGVELQDGLPDGDTWVGKLKFLEKQGKLNLSSYNLEDPIDKEFLYKRYVLATSELIERLSSAARMTGKEVARAERSFQGD
jgi:hypothetical protein